MSKFQQISIVLLRIAIGFLFFYAGITKVMNPSWSAVGYLGGAKTFPGLYHWFASAQNIGWVNLLNEWGLTIVGAFLILGLFVRWASFGGALLMLLYYLPVLDFPYIAPHSLLVDEHVIYFLVFVALCAYRASDFLGLDRLIRRQK